MRNQLLRDTDWASMAHGLEVRVPLVDRVLASRVAPILVQRHNASGKRLLANAPSRPIPLRRFSCVRPKTGFSTPIEVWLEHLSDEGQREVFGAPVRAVTGRGNGLSAFLQALTNTPFGFCSMRCLALVTDAFGGSGLSRNITAIS